MSIFNQKKGKLEGEINYPDAFKKRNGSSQQVGGNGQDNSPNMNHQTQFSHSGEDKRGIERSSADLSSTESRSAESTSSSDARRHPHVYWPKFGENLKNIFGKKGFRIFVDISFIKSKEFPAFATHWAELKGSTPFVYYAFSYEIDDLSTEERSLLNDGSSRPFICSSGVDCITQIASKKLGWSVLLLTADEQNGLALQKAASENNVQMRYYRLDQQLNLCSFRKPQQPKPLESKPYNPMAELAEVSRAIHPAYHVPGAGDTVSAANCSMPIKLVKPVMSDHVSITYTTSDPALFARVYTVQALSIDMFEHKADRMLRDPVSIEGVCWPKDKLFNMHGAFVGILIPAARGVQLAKSVLGGQSGLMRFFPNWNKLDLCSITEIILDIISKLHRLGIHIGCLNPAAIYVADSKHVFFVDTDSWQIEGYPVIARNITHTPPELLGTYQSGHLYTLDEERYQIMLLTFMIMMPGKFPYAKKRGGSVEDSIRDASFQFSLGKKMSRAEDSERPGGVWQMVWDNISYDLCRSFYNSFSKNGFNYSPGKRLSEGVLLNQVRAYKKNLQAAESGLSPDLFPRTFRRDGKHPFYRCQYCGQEHPEFYFLHKIRINGTPIDIWQKDIKICLPCTMLESSDPSARFTCQSCGQLFIYTNKAKIMHDVGRSEFNWAEQKWCNFCKTHTEICPVCKKEIPLYKMTMYEDRLRRLSYKVCWDCKSKLIRERRH